MTRQKKTVLCPLGGVGVGGKWKFWIWYHLLGGTKRFAELQRLLPQASRQMLTIQLREMEQLGLIHRQVYTQKSPKVEYSLTEVGRKMEPVLPQLQTWRHWYGNQSGVESDDWLVGLGGRWKFWIWYHLFNGNRRFNELQQLLPKANSQTLTAHLRELEQMGIVHRQISSQYPSRVEYSLTILGQKAEPLLRQMYAWGKWCCQQLEIDFDWPVNDELEDPLGEHIADLFC